jgi:long-chain acyl-CoA synthetase
VIYTAGITGRHRPITLSFSNVIHNARAFIKEKLIVENDRVLAFLPFYNNWMLLGTLVFPLFAGATCVICRSMEIEDIVETINKYKINIVVCVNSVYEQLINYALDMLNKKYYKLLFKIAETLNNIQISKLFFKKIHKQFGNSIRYFLSIGTKVPKEIYQDFLTLGFEIYEGYGMQETAGVITIPESKRNKPHSVGKFIDGLHHKIIDKEIVVRGPSVAKSYYNRPEENAIHYNGS